MNWARLTRAGELRWHVAYRVSPEDAAAKLAELFRSLNAGHFGGRLPEVPIRVSGRLKRRLGQLTRDRATGRPVSITLSRRHLERHSAEEVAHTLLHEMVHLWQHAEGHAVGHGATFRSKARELGIAPAACRVVSPPLHPTPHTLPPA